MFDHALGWRKAKTSARADPRMQRLEIERTVLVDGEQKQARLLVPQKQVLGERASYLAAEAFALFNVA
jgi:hypothetical protein